jgi:Flp pilus assembly protein TadD
MEPCRLWAHEDLTTLPNSVQIIQYKTTLWINPEDLETRNKLAMAYYLNNELEESEKELRYILKRDPGDFNALDGLGIVLIKKKKYQEALKHLEKAARINGQDMMVHVHLSVVYREMNSHAKADSALKKANMLATNRIKRRQIEKELKLVSSP